MDVMPAIPAGSSRRSPTGLHRVGPKAATLASLAFLATACSAGLPNAAAPTPTPASTAGRSTQGTMGGGSPAFVECMRSHGMPNFPSNGRITPDSGISPSSTQFQKSLDACKSLAPPGWVDSGPVSAGGGG